MRGVEAFLMGGLVLVGLYLVLTRNAGPVIGSIAGGVSSIFKTLQGRG